MRASVRKINGVTIKQNPVLQTISLINFSSYIIAVRRQEGF